MLKSINKSGFGGVAYTYENGETVEVVVGDYMPSSFRDDDMAGWDDRLVTDEAFVYGSRRYARGSIESAKVGQVVVAFSRGKWRVAEIVKVGRKNVRVEYASPGAIQNVLEGYGLLVTGKSTSVWWTMADVTAMTFDDEPEVKQIEQTAPAATPTGRVSDSFVTSFIEDIKRATPGITKTAALRAFRAAGHSCRALRFNAVFAAV